MSASLGEIAVLSLDSHEFEIECPACGFYNEATIRQARLRDVVICRGCKNNIRLEDSMNSCRKAARQADRAVRELEEEIEKVNRMLSF